MVCSACGHENRPDASFCGVCGRALVVERDCPTCARANPLGQRFCDGCGAPLDASPEPRAPTEQPSPAHPRSLSGGRYRIERFLGEGGRKRVYLVT